MKKEKKQQHPDWQTTAKERFSYYLGLISPYTMSGMMGSFLTTYLLLSGIGLEVSAVLLLVMKIVDGFDDLLFGWVIDRFRPEKNPKLAKIVGKGRFLPWYKLIWPIMPIGILGLYCMPLSLSTPLKIAWVAFFYFMADVGYSFMDISMTSMQTTLTSNTHERDQLIMKGMVTLFVIMVPISAAANILASSKVGLSFRTIAFIFVALVIILLIPMITKVEEHAYTGKDESNTNVTDEKAPFFRSLLDALHNRNLLAFYGGKMLQSMLSTTDALGIIGAYYLFGNELVTTIQGMVGTVLGFVIMLILPKIYEKHDRHKIYMTFTPISIALAVIVYLMGHKNIALYIVMQCLLQIPKSIAGGCENFMKPQVIEYGKYKTGKDLTGIQASLSTFASVFSNAFPGSIALAILGAAGWVTVEAESFKQLAEMGVAQPNSAIKALWFITAGLPIIGYVLLYVCNLFYNLNDKDVAIMIRYNNGEITREECDALLSKKY
ncbi:MAG: MFS transporter [Erysipelotrichaceae bacterium]|nr:MFS transporter [Erysipelotrichaceae bacterium]